MQSRNIKMMATIIAVAIFFVSLDRFLKILALNYFTGGSASILGEVFKFNFAPNYFIAFSLPIGGIFLNIFIALIIICLIIYLIFLAKKKDYIKAGYLTIILFGAISNLMDRLLYGYVIDYLDLKYFTVFNIADMMILGGVSILSLSIFFKSKKN